MLLAGLVACGPDPAEDPPAEWYLGEWFIQTGDCPEACSPEILVQIEVEPGGTATIYRESFCQLESRDELTWVEQDSELLRFEPVDPTTNGLEMPDFDHFTIRYENECRAVGEEATHTVPLRRGPVRLAPPEDLHDCDGLIVPEDETFDEACLEGQ